MAAQPGQCTGRRECMHVVCIQAGAAREIVHAAKGALSACHDQPFRGGFRQAFDEAQSEAQGGLGMVWKSPFPLSSTTLTPAPLPRGEGRFVWRLRAI